MLPKVATKEHQMDWNDVWQVLPTVATILLGILAFWLNSQKDVEVAKRKIGEIIGDVIANAIENAKGQMALVTDEMLLEEAGWMYDSLAELLPEKIEALVRTLYSKQDFCQLVLKAWRNHQSRSMIVDGTIEASPYGGTHPPA
jgi:hypothetical protein